MKKCQVELRPTDRDYLENLLRKGQLGARQFKRATGLLELDRGKPVSAVATTLSVSETTVRAWRERYEQEGLQMLHDKPRSGRPIEFDGEQRAKITALACSEAPVGHDRWDLRLLADKAVELNYCQSISHTQVAKILKKTS
ncbi:helix-turn-helix domain containing protein [Thermoleptolyngbya oregonensis NK1-22]|uniref:Helix-turn-helix domain containing protein n=1 Tax=Thermoleptolyngbya oregonensis NK1-22 TaxID=2547457 RepID=A0AA96Y2Y2_9CYAN|nr:helix-turn-helix domain-containing protein [Thermoleptolyngbya sp. M55_K2018_002]WOB42006.1 helix-turn-helix domain containing protein [Thermoleptolyngbya oregonensis NK1-22]WOB43242.1 helix-turn-helix domain containing protein [Thermoleptolyngbya oregonensis NK1-22]WOB43496.1 helix-turn-helix domain containing protein [Thermoleptolyngbya oregonensis NK1-22]WOB43659.1 helix-turn-helix domain containing protein [Thermoleptolyngbya oregonensis NK1-22]WOB43900.1 helix-turn-helix domain contain